VSAVESPNRAGARQDPSDPRASAQRPYETLLAKGDDRKQRIIAIAERLVARNGWRNTSLAQIAREAGVTPAGLLHHFESKEQLLNAVLDARDTDDDTHADRAGDLITEICRVAERFDRAPELVGTFTVLLIENIEPDAPLHDRLVARQKAAVDIVADLIRAGQARGHYRTDLDPAVKAIEILAFINGMETAWLLDPSIPLNDVFKGYAETLARDFTLQAARGQSAALDRSAT
jgi:AcrR family transcriptional regulator